jgi:uncharacterized membrane protein
VELEEFLHDIIRICIMLLEMFGVSILVYTSVQCFIKWIKGDTGTRITLARGIALALEFKLGGEVLRTVVVRSWIELGVLGAVIALRGLLSFLILWGIKNEPTVIEGEKEGGAGPPA